LQFTVINASGTSAPVISNLTYSKFVTSSGKQGLSGSFDFSDSDGDIVYTGSLNGSARIVLRMSGADCIITDAGKYLDKAGLTSGHVEFSFSYSASTMYIGGFPVSFQLIDASGNQSNLLSLSPTPSIWYCEMFRTPAGTQGAQSPGFSRHVSLAGQRQPSRPFVRQQPFLRL
jgi:hypothetical protein